MTDKTKEFNLSDFRQLNQNVWSYEEEQVKEFIRLERKIILKYCLKQIDVNEFGITLNKLAGDKLV